MWKALFIVVVLSISASPLDAAQPDNGKRMEKTQRGGDLRRDVEPDLQGNLSAQRRAATATTPLAAISRFGGRRATVVGRRHRLKKRNAFLPACFAEYIAASACLSSVAASPASSGNTLTPMLAEMLTCATAPMS